MFDDLEYREELNTTFYDWYIKHKGHSIESGCYKSEGKMNLLSICNRCKTFMVRDTVRNYEGVKRKNV